jgi:phosphopantetheinyl transferase (holo-ACP synthase)
LKNQVLKIESHVVKVIIDDFSQKIPGILEDHFSQAERACAEQSSMSTLAANYAVKLSFCKLTVKNDVPCPALETLEIGRKSSGEPTLEYTGTNPGIIQLASQTHISISHTKKTAYGLTVVGKPE